MAKFIQVGVTALRNPMGGFYPSVPIYIRTDEAVKGSGLTPSEEAPLHELSTLFAIKHAEIQAKGGLGK